MPRTLLSGNRVSYPSAYNEEESDDATEVHSRLSYFDRGFHLEFDWVCSRC